MEKEMLEHFQYLQNKGLYNIEFIEDSVKSTRIDFGIPQKLNISLLQDNSKTSMCHGTTLENTKKIIKDGFIKGVNDRGKDRIEYNKIFMTEKVWLARQYGAIPSIGDNVVITIDITKYQVYSFIENLGMLSGVEWVIWDKINIKDVKFTYFKDNISMGELTSEEIMKLPIVLPLSTDVFCEAIGNNNMYFFNEPYGIHGMLHANRVILILQQLAENELLTTPQKTILAYAGLYHDIGRNHSEENHVHGFESYRIIFNTGLIDTAEGLNAEELEIMRFIIQCHCINDEAGYAAIKGYNIKDIELAKSLYDIFKDANSLDKQRCGNFDITYLRRPCTYLSLGYVEKLYKIS